MKVVDLGVVSYAEALSLQEEAVEDVAGGGGERVYVLEHKPVVTFGRHGGEAFLRFTPEELARRGIETHKASRGGSVTCHFPGQAVIYPVTRLSGRPGGLKKYFHDLEQAGIDALASFGIGAGRSEGRPGVWTGHRKIASCGVAVRKWITYHGLALNAGPDLSLFEVMTACGLPGVTMTSIARERERLGLEPATIEMEHVKHALVQAFLDRHEQRG